MFVSNQIIHIYILQHLKTLYDNNKSVKFLAVITTPVTCAFYKE